MIIIISNNNNLIVISNNIIIISNNNNSKVRGQVVQLQHISTDVEVHSGRRLEVPGLHGRIKSMMADAFIRILNVIIS